MPKSKNVFLVAFSFVGRHLHIKFQNILSNGLDFANFLHFWSISAVFLAKKSQNRKIAFLLNFFLLGSIYIPNFRKLYQTVLILPIFFIFGQFWLFFGQKKAQKCQNQKCFFVAFSFVGKHQFTKFQKISSNGLNFANFLHFGQFRMFFGQKKAKKC